MVSSAIGLLGSWVVAGRIVRLTGKNAVSHSTLVKPTLTISPLNPDLTGTVRTTSCLLTPPTKKQNKIKITK
jgi:hypothetical protein